MGPIEPYFSDLAIWTSNLKAQYDLDFKQKVISFRRLRGETQEKS